MSRILSSEEKDIINSIFQKNPEAVKILCNWYKDNDNKFLSNKISYFIEKYDGDKLCEYVLSYCLNICQKCGSNDTSVENFDPRFRDGDLICQNCRNYVREYDAS